MLSAVILFFFFLMIRRPPRSTLFPYRRSSDLKPAPVAEEDPARDLSPEELVLKDDKKPRPKRRSEEHTSELQSHSDLVCRLLLEKKKKNKKKKKKITK